MRHLHPSIGIVCRTCQDNTNKKQILVLQPLTVFTSPAGAVVKYCDEYVCLCVCLSTRISPEPHARSLPNFLCKLHVSVARSSSDMFMIGCIAYRREGVFFPVDNAYASRTTRAIFTIGHIAYRWEGVFFPLTMHISPELHARSLPFFVHVACVRASVLIRHFYDRPHCVWLGRGFLPY